MTKDEGGEGADWSKMTAAAGGGTKRRGRGREGRRGGGEGNEGGRGAREASWGSAAQTDGGVCDRAFIYVEKIADAREEGGEVVLRSGTTLFGGGEKTAGRRICGTAAERAPGAACAGRMLVGWFVHRRQEEVLGFFHSDE